MLDFGDYQWAKNILKQIELSKRRAEEFNLEYENLNREAETIQREERGIGQRAGLELQLMSKELLGLMKNAEGFLNTAGHQKSVPCHKIVIDR